MTTETKTPAPLTPAELEARKAIIAAANAAPVTASVPPSTATVPADSGGKAEATTPAIAPEKPAMVPPTGAATVAAALIAANPSKPPVTAAQVTAGAEKAVTAALGTKANPVPTVAAPQGGKPTTSNPHTKPVAAATPKQGGTAGGGKGKGKAAPDKPAADDGTVYGYQLSRWPAWFRVDDKAVQGSDQPSKADIVVANALLANRNGPTKKVLALAFYLSPASKRYNVYDVATALRDVCGGADDHKMNVVNEQAAKQGLVKRVDQPSLTYRNPANTATAARARVVYHVELTPKGRQIATAACEAAGVKMPKYMLPPDKPVNEGKGQGTSK